MQSHMYKTEMSRVVRGEAGGGPACLVSPWGPWGTQLGTQFGNKWVQPLCFWKSGGEAAIPASQHFLDTHIWPLLQA